MRSTKRNKASTSHTNAEQKFMIVVVVDDAAPFCLSHNSFKVQKKDDV